jgi:hypothetical protein
VDPTLGAIIAAALVFLVMVSAGASRGNAGRTAT